MQLSLSAKKIESLFLTAILILVTLSVSGQIYKFTLGRERFLVNLFDLDMEWNLPTLYSALALGLTSFILYVISLDAKVRNLPFRLHWTILSAGFLVMALDEIMVFHEKLSSPTKALLLQYGIHTDGLLRFTWIVPFSVLAVILGLSYVRFILHLPAPMRVRVVSAAAVYLAGAMGIEAVSGLVLTEFGRDTLTYAMVVNLEELLEMLGVYLFISALLTYLLETVPYLQVRLLAGAWAEDPISSRLQRLLPVIRPNRVPPHPSPMHMGLSRK